MRKTAPGKAAPAAAGPADSNLAETVLRAKDVFQEKNLRFTELREQVFKEIAAIRGSIGAYEILERLSNKGTRLAPISVYRSIDALMDAGVIHRLESKNAYFACRRHEHGAVGRPIFLACEECGAVREVPAQHVFDEIKDLAASVGFQPKVKFVEVSGLCSDCATAEATMPSRTTDEA
ncbi:MAG: Fur family transcriptional regulator [Pseudomonadota bacterium]